MKQDREQYFLKLLNRHQTLSVSETAQMLQVSPATVRRMFQHLAEQKLIRRTHGGACNLETSSADHMIPFFKREQWFSNVKRRLAQKTLEYIPRHSILSIHGGSTTVLLATLLEDCTIITNSWIFCEILNQRFPMGDGPELILTGGSFKYRNNIFLGSAAERAMARYHTDIALFSFHSLDESGTFDYDDESVSMQQVMADNADMKIAIADHSKFQAKGICRSLRWQQIDMLITDYSPDSAETVNEIRKQGVETIILPADSKPV